MVHLLKILLKAHLAQSHLETFSIDHSSIVVGMALKVCARILHFNKYVCMFSLGFLNTFHITCVSYVHVTFHRYPALYLTSIKLCNWKF